MALKIIDHGTNEYNEMVELRYQILRKPLGLFFTLEELENEKYDTLIGCYDDDILEGCCLLTPVENNAVRLRQMAVANGLQGKGIGRALMSFSENIARDMGKSMLLMHARKTAIGFYEKLDYHINSAEFDEVTIPHYVMAKNL